MIEDSKRPEPRFKGLAHGVKLIVQEEGYRGVYRGLGPVVSILRNRPARAWHKGKELTQRCCGKEQTRPCDSRHTRRSSSWFRATCRPGHSCQAG